MACMNGIGEDEFVHRGRKRRHRHDDDMHANGPVARSQLAHMLLEMWAWGEISAYRLQQMAEAGVHDGIGHPDMRKLASLGTNGKHSGNCHRDLTRYLDKIVHMPEPVPMTIPLKMDDDNVNIVDIPLLPLHRLFAHMAQHWPLEFEARVTGPPSALQDFWNTVKPQDPKFVAWQGALQQRPEYKTKCIPLALHGDGVPVFKGKSMYIVSANSLLGTGCSMDQKFFMCGYWGHLLNKNKVDKTLDTEDNVWRYIQWDLEALWSGTFPLTDADGRHWPRGSQEAKDQGKPLASGYFGVPWILKADLEYYANVMHLEHWSRGHNPCCKCKVDRDQFPWTDYRLVGDPRVQWSEPEWRAAHPHCHRFFNILHCGLHAVVIDIMHTMSLGVAQHVGANVLFELVWSAIPSGTLQQKLMEVWCSVKEYYSVNQVRTRVSKLTLAMITDTQRPQKVYPHLATKAKETEWLCRALETIWPQYMNKNIDVHCHIMRTLSLVVDIYTLASTDGIFHSDIDSLAIMDAVHNLQAHYNWLAKWAEDRNLRRWNTVYKHHMIGHIAEDSQWLHVRAGATYMDEDFMGRMKTVAKKCTGGTALYKLGATVIVKYTRGLYMRWSSRASGTLFQC